MNNFIELKAYQCFAVRPNTISRNNYIVIVVSRQRRRLQIVYV